VFTYSGLKTVNVSVDFLTSASLTAGSNQPFYGKSSGVTIVGYKLFKSTGELTGATAQLNGATLAIIEGYSSIGANAFLNAASLTSIIIPASVTTIGLSAFYECSKLTTITIPVSVTFIGQDAFTNSGLITMYVSTGNKLGLTPSTPMPLYGKTFTIIGNAPAVAPTIPICFLAGTKVTTDQGNIAIEKLNPKLHTIRGKKIVSITKSAPLKKIFYKGKGVKAIDLVEGYQGAPENNSELLYIVRIKK
jgi:hypothetical protein